MRDWELYATILGVQAPGRVERVELDVAGGAVHVWLARTEGAPAPCPECQTACPIYDHREREWRHLDTCQLQPRVHARVPRVDCPTHGVLQSPVPWATSGSKFTLLFERLAIDWLREAAVTAVARQLQPMIEKARMLKTHLPNILTYLRHRITNATAEGLNSKIQWIRYTARGFRNRENFKTAIYFHCGGLDLYPH